MTQAGSPSLSYQALWQRLRRLLEQVFLVADRATLIDEALDAILELSGADRGLVHLIEADGAASVINARGRGGALSAWEREEISKSVLAQARASGVCVLWEPPQEAGGGGAESLVSLGISAAMATPLRAVAWAPGAPGAVRGTLYVDFRDPSVKLGAQQREFFETAALYLATLLEQSRELANAREEARSARASGGEPARPSPSLEELLRPESMAGLRDEVRSAVDSDAPMLICGESGTGKTLLARAVAEASGRRPIVRAMLGTSDDLNTVASELFGHERGAFSGAVGRRTGLVEFADGGTLILDEILNLHPRAQQLLLDFTQFGSYRPLGYERAEPKRARVRVIAATNGDIDAAVRDGRLRQDLYYRLAAVRLVMPPLRTRREEIPALAEAHLRRVDPARSWHLSLGLRRLLMSPQLSWPGNVRQMEMVIERARDRALLRGDGEQLRLEASDVRADDLGLSGPLPAAGEGAAGAIAAPPVAEVELVTQRFEIDPADLAESYGRLQRERQHLDEIERRVLEGVLAQQGGVPGSAARLLGLGRTSLLSRMRTLGIDAGRPKGKA